MDILGKFTLVVFLGDGICNQRNGSVCCLPDARNPQNSRRSKKARSVRSIIFSKCVKNAGNYRRNVCAHQIADCVMENFALKISRRAALHNLSFDASISMSRQISLRYRLLKNNTSPIQRADAQTIRKRRKRIGATPFESPILASLFRAVQCEHIHSLLQC